MITGGGGDTSKINKRRPFSSHKISAPLNLSAPTNERRQRRDVTSERDQQELTNRCQMMSNRKCIHGPSESWGKKKNRSRSLSHFEWKYHRRYFNLNIFPSPVFVVAADDSMVKPADDDAFPFCKAAAEKKGELNNKNNRLDSAQRQISSQSVTRSRILCYSFMSSLSVVLSRRASGGGKMKLQSLSCWLWWWRVRMGIKSTVKVKSKRLGKYGGN